jgi:5-methylcytosine-specific restriction endonuclease McrA
MRALRGTGMPLAFYRERRRAKAPPTRDGIVYAAILRGDPCVYCWARCEQVDHVVPVAAGGTGDWTNLAPTCESCNRGKGTKSVLEFLLVSAS